jgi:hypothetical protein
VFGHLPSCPLPVAGDDRTGNIAVVALDPLDNAIPMQTTSTVECGMGIGQLQDDAVEEP